MQFGTFTSCATFKFVVLCMKTLLLWLHQISDHIASEDPQLLSLARTGAIGFATKPLIKYCRFGGMYTMPQMIFIAR
jgi:hypothetical protein